MHTSTRSSVWDCVSKISSTRVLDTARGFLFVEPRALFAERQSALDIKNPLSVFE